MKTTKAMTNLQRKMHFHQLAKAALEAAKAEPGEAVSPFGDEYPTAPAVRYDESGWFGILNDTTGFGGDFEAEAVVDSLETGWWEFFASQVEKGLATWTEVDQALRNAAWRMGL